MNTSIVQWVDCKERLPEDDREVLCYFPHVFDPLESSARPVFIGTCQLGRDNCRYWQTTDGYFNPVDGVTHWAELPKGPNT